MNAATIRRLATALAVAVVLWAALALTRSVREDRAARITLPRVDTGAIDTVSIARKGDSAVLARGAHGAWTANGHAADTARVHELLRALADTASWGEVVAENRSSHARLGVDADSGRHVRVFSHGKTLLDVTTGTRTADWGGVYLRRGTEDAVYAMHGSNLGDPFTRSADDWRDKRIAHVAPESVATAEVQRAGVTTVLRKEGVHWAMAGGRATDSSAVASWLDAFRDLSALGFPSPAQLDSARFAKPRAGVRLRDKGGHLLLSLVFDSTAGLVLTRADSGGTVFRLDPWQLTRLAPSESTLKEKKPKKRTG